jgi:hypothetical protein
MAGRKHKRDSMKQEYHYIEKETEKGLLLTDGSGSFWISKKIVDIHPKYNFLARPYSFYTFEEKTTFKTWKRMSFECVIPLFTVNATCSWCSSYLDEWVDHTYKIEKTTKFSCPKCRSKFKPDELSIKLEFIKEPPLSFGGRVYNFIKDNRLSDYELFTNPHTTIKGQLKILDQDMREHGGYYEYGISNLEESLEIW